MIINPLSSLMIKGEVKEFQSKEGKRLLILINSSPFFQNFMSSQTSQAPSASSILQEARRNLSRDPSSPPMHNPYSSQSVLDPNLWRMDESSSGPSQVTYPSTRYDDNR